MNKEIYLAGGCFWGVEALVHALPGIISAESGYANGSVAAPSYELVKTGTTGHRETVHVVYDTSVISLEAILAAYFSVIDPTVKNRQAMDIGTQYQTGIYYLSDEDGDTARRMAEGLGLPDGALMTEIKPLSSFYRAEEYHQRYLEKNPNGYCHIPFDKIAAAVRIAESFKAK